MTEVAETLEAKHPTKENESKLIPLKLPPMTEVAGTSKTKRPLEEEDETIEALENTKRIKEDLKNQSLKVKVLTLIIKAFENLSEALFTKDLAKTYMNKFIVSNKVTILITNLHTENEKRAFSVHNSNTTEETAATDFKLHVLGIDYNIKRKDASDIWNACVCDVGLEYKMFSAVDHENWYAIINTHLNCFRAFSWRVRELRLGFKNVYMGKEELWVPIFKYGLSDRHFSLLEGCTFPFESMAEFMGPMTAFLCMLQSKQDRKKWEMIVKKKMAHVNCIDAVISNCNNSTILERCLIGTLADILLITIQRHPIIMSFPVCMLRAVYRSEPDQNAFLEFFDTSGPGGFYTYKKAALMKGQWNTLFLDTDAARQIVFHGIFGTYKEDLKTLALVTDTKEWYSSKKMETAFKLVSDTRSVPLDLPELSYYPMTLYDPNCGNQRYLPPLCCAVFSGYRRVRIGGYFRFNVLQRKIKESRYNRQYDWRCELNCILEELLKETRKEKYEVTDTDWYSMEALELNNVPVSRCDIFKD